MCACALVCVRALVTARARVCASVRVCSCVNWCNLKNKISVLNPPPHQLPTRSAGRENLYDFSHNSAPLFE